MEIQIFEGSILNSPWSFSDFLFIGFYVVEERSGRRQPGAGAKVWRKWLHQSPVTCADNVTALIRASPNRICVAPLIAAPGELLLAVHRSYRNACGKRKCYSSVMNFVYI